MSGLLHSNICKKKYHEISTIYTAIMKNTPDLLMKCVPHTPIYYVKPITSQLQPHQTHYIILKAKNSVMNTSAID